MKLLAAVGAAAVLGAGAGAGVTAVLTSGAHESISIQRGDTLAPHFSVRTDSVLAVSGTRIVASRCGSSAIFLRTFRGQTQVSADTIDVTVSCIPKAATLEVCLFPNPDSMLKYHVSTDTSIDPKLVPCDSATGTIRPDSTGRPAVKRISMVSTQLPVNLHQE